MLYDKKIVKQVDVPSYSGSFGILANHVPVLAVIKPGVVTVFEEDGSANKFFGKLPAMNSPCGLHRNRARLIAILITRTQ